MTRESFPGYTPPKGPLVHGVSWIERPTPCRGGFIRNVLCGAALFPDIHVTMYDDAITCEACRRAWREAQP